MVDPHEPVGPDVGTEGVDVDSDGRRDTLIVAGLAAPTVVVDLDRDGCGDVMIEVSPAGETRMTALTDIGGGWLAQQPVALDPVAHRSETDLSEPYPSNDSGDDGGDPVDLVDCLLNLFSGD